jgi:hypothetical protein
MSKRVVGSAAACVSLLYEPLPLSQEERLTLNAVVAAELLPSPFSTLAMSRLHERLTSLHRKKRQHPILGGTLSIILSAASILPSYRGAGCHYTHSCRFYRTEDIVAALTSIIPTPSAIIA